MSEETMVSGQIAEPVPQKW